MSLSAVAVSDQIDSFWVLVEIVRVWCLILTAGCRGHVNKLATEPFVLLHCEHGTGYQQSWNCCERQTSYVAIWKHFCFILSTGTRIRTDSVMCPRSSSRGAIQVPQLQLQLADCSILETVNEAGHCQLRTTARRAFSVVGPSLWNSLPDQLCDPAFGRDIFRQHLETFMFASY